jgi:hypothetical protein
MIRSCWSTKLLRGWLGRNLHMSMKLLVGLLALGVIMIVVGLVIVFVGLP